MKTRALFTFLLAALVAGCGDDANTTDAAANTTDAAVADGASPTDAPRPDGGTDAVASDAPAATTQHQVILFVWDGLRPDSIADDTTPTLSSLKARGVNFTDNHSTYPTFTMMNGASLATGNFPEGTGFYGNTLWAPGAMGNSSAGAPVDYQQPVFTEDYAVLRSLKSYYQGKLLLAGTLFEAAHKAGLTTAAVGKSGPAFLQDSSEEGGLIIDEKLASPLAFARELQTAGYHLPLTTPVAYPSDAGAPADGGIPSQIMESANPTNQGATRKLYENFASDPPADDTTLTRQNDSNEYLMRVFTDYILPKKKPDLSMVWLRNPDSSEHDYGPGSPSYRRALRSQDELLGVLLTKLRELGTDKTTDVIVVSDHGHSSVSASLTVFPLRFIVGDQIDPVTKANTRKPGPVVPPDVLTATPSAGWSVSGEMRLPDLLSAAGKGWKAYDGQGCFYNPVLSGIDALGNRLAADRLDPALCPSAFVTPGYKVPADVSDPASIVVAANGGSDYLYFPDTMADRRAALVKDVVRFLQSRAEIGAIFVASQYGDVPGTLSMKEVHLESTRATPDVILSYTWDDTAAIQGVPGIEYSSLNGSSNRGMHGSFSPRDVHNTLLAAGPSFKGAYADPLPSGNVDVAPTVARVLGLSLPTAAGRPLLEALATGGMDASAFMSASSTVKPTTDATGLAITQPSGAPDGTADSYSIELAVKTLSYSDGGQARSFKYFDQAKAVRSKKP